MLKLLKPIVSTKASCYLKYLDDSAVKQQMREKKEGER